MSTTTASHVKSTAETPAQLHDAYLGGIPCKAMAWVEVTRLRVVDGRSGQRLVDGIRTWHGQAIVQCDVVPTQWEYNSAVRYVGKVKDGEDVREIDAEVYIHHRLYRPPRLASNSTQPHGEGAQHQLQVRFTGAGNLRVL